MLTLLKKKNIVGIDGDNLVSCTGTFKLVARYKDFTFEYHGLKNVISLPVCLSLEPTQQAAQVQDVLVCCNWQIRCTSPALPIACQTGICIEIVELREHKEDLGWLSASWMQEVSRNVFVTASCS